MKIQFLLLAGTMALSVAAVAQSAAAPADQTAAAPHRLAKLDELQDENAMLTLQIRNAKLKNDLAAAISGTAPPEGSAGGAPGQQSATSARTPAFGLNAAPSVPVVELVSTSERVNNGLPTALVTFPNGGQQTVIVGSKLPGIGEVISVSVREVLVRQSGHILSLPFASSTGEATALIAPGFSGGK